jgi:predicted nucleotidyltransferase
MQFRYGDLVLKNLFSSQVRIDLLSTLLMHPDEEFYLRELAVKLDSSPRSINVELRNLEKIKLILKRISGKQHYYRINLQHPLYADLRNLFLKTIGLRYQVIAKLEPYAAEIDFAFIYGSMASGSFNAESDIDLLIIGNLRPRQMSPIFAALREQLGREINTAIYPVAEFADKVRWQDHFISKVITESLLFVIGEEHEFRRLVQKWLAEKTSNLS